MEIKSFLRFTIILIVFLISLLGFSLIGYAETIDDFEFTLSGNNATITGYNYYDAIDLIIPEKLGEYTVVGIGYNVCWGLWDLEYVEIPKTVVDIEDGAFISCANLQEFSVDTENKSYCDIDGNLFTKDGKKLIQYAIGKKDLAYQIPNGVQKIGYEAFGYSKLENIYIPDTVEIIEYSAFYHCSAIANISIPDSVETIEKGAFDYCTNLESIVLPDKVTVINDETFRYCTNLKSITLSPNISEIGCGAFYQCTSLEKFVMPDSVEKIGDYAFYYCTELTDILVSQELKTVGYGAFISCDNLENVYYPESIVSWSEIDVAGENICLTSATKNYNYVPIISSELKLDGQTIAADITMPIVYMPENSKLILGYFLNNSLETTVVKSLSQDDELVSISIPYQNIDQIKIFVWEGLDTLKAIIKSNEINIE